MSQERWNPYSVLPQLPLLAVTSSDIRDGEPLPAVHYGTDVGGANISPQLSWSAGPSGTRSYAVTVYDPDAPTASGFWHWAVFDIPPSVTALPTNAGSANHAALPDGAVTLPNEARLPQYIGAAPPDREHRYFFVVHAVDVPHLDIDDQATPATLGFNLSMGHGLARGILIATATPRGALA